MSTNPEPGGIRALPPKTTIMKKLSEKSKFFLIENLARILYAYEIKKIFKWHIPLDMQPVIIDFFELIFAKNPDDELSKIIKNSDLIGLMRIIKSHYTSKKRS